MGRTDSAFDAPYKSSIHEIKTSPNRQSVTKSSSPHSSIPHSPTENTRRRRTAPAQRGSKHESRNPSKASGQRRKSLASSSEDSAHSRPRRGHESKHSSNRTSFNIVDPSRPARHYRINSNHSVISANRDVDDPLALHFRSCALFKDPSIGVKVHSLQSDSHEETQNPGSRLPIIALPRDDIFNDAQDMTLHKEPLSSSSLPPATKISPVTTTTHWLSPESRQKQYKKIDKANTGIRSMVRKVTPRIIAGTPPPRFYEKDTSDAGSVRRYRIDIENASQGTDQVGENDDVTSVSHEPRVCQKGPLIPAPPSLMNKTTKRTKKGTKRWKLMCF